MVREVTRTGYETTTRLGIRSACMRFFKWCCARTSPPQSGASRRLSPCAARKRLQAKSAEMGTHTLSATHCPEHATHALASIECMHSARKSRLRMRWHAATADERCATCRSCLSHGGMGGEGEAGSLTLMPVPVPHHAATSCQA